MDTEPGIEKLFVVISDRPLDIAQKYDLENRGEPRPSSGGSNDTDEEVTGQLRAWTDNAQVAFADEKGIGLGNSQSYGITVDSGKPAVVEVSLRHYRR